MIGEPALQDSVVHLLKLSGGNSGWLLALISCAVVLVLTLCWRLTRKFNGVYLYGSRTFKVILKSVEDRFPDKRESRGRCSLLFYRLGWCYAVIKVPDNSLYATLRLHPVWCDERATWEQARDRFLRQDSGGTGG